MIILENSGFPISFAIICIAFSVSHGWDQSKYSRTHNSKYRLRRDVTGPNDYTQEDTQISPRIVGGRPARFGETPYQVRIEARGELHCGGSIISHCGFMFVLTAAHCVRDITGGYTNDTLIPLKDLYVVAADLKRNSWQPREQWFSPAEIVSHEDFDPRYFLNDIAVIRVDRYMFESLGLEHIELPGIDWVDPEYCAVSGWGASDHWAGNHPDELQYAELPVVPWHVCKSLPHLAPEFLTPTQFCLGNRENHLKGICDGDSGGPATAFNWTSQKWYLAGITSYLITGICGNRWSASTFTRVTNYVDWIKGRAVGWLERYGTGNPYNNQSLCNPY